MTEFIQVTWDEGTKKLFDQLIAKVPGPMQGFAEDRVSRKAENTVREDGRSEVTEKDMIDAFFSETPFGFHGPMKTDMESLGIDYTKYGHA